MICENIWDIMFVGLTKFLLKFHFFCCVDKNKKLHKCSQSNCWQQKGSKSTLSKANTSILYLLDNFWNHNVGCKQRVLASLQSVKWKVFVETARLKLLLINYSIGSITSESIGHVISIPASGNELIRACVRLHSCNFVRSMKRNRWS